MALQNRMELQYRQELTINPRLYQAMDLLQMPLMDLQMHLKQELMVNPFLELAEESEDGIETIDKELGEETGEEDEGVGPEIESEPAPAGEEEGNEELAQEDDSGREGDPDSESEEVVSLVDPPEEGDLTTNTHDEIDWDGILSENDFDYDNQVIATGKYDTKNTYKRTKGYFPGVATIGNKIVYVENRDGNANVKFEQASTLTRSYNLLKENGIEVNRSRMDAGSYSKDIIEVVASNSKLFYIRANKSAELFRQISEIETWETVEINYKLYQVASIPFAQFFEQENYRLVIMREKGKGNQIDMFTGDTFMYRSILTNDWESTEKQVIEFYNQRGSSEKLFDVMNNDFGWKHLPCSFMNENTAFLIITAMAKNFYNYFVEIVSKVFSDIKPTTRLKRFIFRFISVAGKWIYTGRQWVLKLYTDRPYESLIV